MTATAQPTPVPDLPDVPAWSAVVSRIRRAVGRGEGTTRRFVLLLMLFTAGSADMYGTILKNIIDPHDYVYYCQLAAGYDPNSNDPQYFIQAAAQSGQPGYTTCLETHASGWRFAWLPFAATAAVLALAALLYLALPAWHRRKRWLVPISAADPDRTLRAFLKGLEGRAGVSTSPDYRVDLSAGGIDALVFGRLGSYTVRLDAGLLALFRRDERAFEATVLHELAHLRNRDVDVTYLTVALWRVFLVCVLAPFAVTEAFRLGTGLSGRPASPFLSGELPSEARDIVLAAFITVLIYRVMADVLRVREHAADIDAVESGADWIYWLQHAAAPDPRTGAKIVGAVKAAMRTHPDWPARVAALLRPRDLVILPASSMFALGAATQLLGSFVYDALDSDTASTLYGWMQIAAVWPTAILTTAIAGSAVWREAAHALEAGRPAPSGLRAGFWLGVGQLAGELVLSDSFGTGWLLPFPWILTLGLLVLVPAAILWWTAGCAALWSRPPGRRSTIARVAVLAVTTAAFALWFDWWQLPGSMFTAGDPFPESLGFADFYAGYPHTTTTDIMAALTWPVTLLGNSWGFFLSAGLWILPLLGPRIRGARSIGVWSGCAAVAAVVVVTWRAHEWMARANETFDQNLNVYIAWLFAILWCAAVGAAILAALRHAGSAVPAMTAAGIATVLGAAAIVVLSGTDGCIGPLAALDTACTVPATGSWDFDAAVLGFLLPLAGMCSLVVAALAAGIVRMTVGGQPRSGPAVQGNQRASSLQPGRRLQRVGAGAVCLLLIAGCIGSYVDGRINDSGSSSDADTIAGAPGAVVEPTLVQTAQITSWLYMGGEADITALGDIAQQLVSATRDADSAEIEHVCSSAASLTASARAYLLPPDVQLQQAWSTTWSDSATGAQACLIGLSQHDSLQAFLGLSEIQNGYEAALHLLAQYYPMTVGTKY